MDEITVVLNIDIRLVAACLGISSILGVLLNIMSITPEHRTKAYKDFKSFMGSSLNIFIVAVTAIVQSIVWIIEIIRL